MRVEGEETVTLYTVVHQDWFNMLLCAFLQVQASKLAHTFICDTVFRIHVFIDGRWSVHAKLQQHVMSYMNNLFGMLTSIMKTFVACWLEPLTLFEN